MRYLAAAALGSVLVLLSACGQKGDLYLPALPAADAASQQQPPQADAAGQDPADDHLLSQ